jgi:hypothetical protein
MRVVVDNSRRSMKDWILRMKLLPVNVDIVGECFGRQTLLMDNYSAVVKVPLN